MEQLVARRAHNPKVVGSSPAPATKTENQSFGWFFYFKVDDFQSRGGVPMNSGVARRADNQKVVGSTPAPATKPKTSLLAGFFILKLSIFNRGVESR